MHLLCVGTAGKSVKFVCCILGSCYCVEWFFTWGSDQWQNRGCNLEGLVSKSVGVYIFE